MLNNRQRFTRNLVIGALMLCGLNVPTARASLCVGSAATTCNNVCIPSTTAANAQTFQCDLRTNGDTVGGTACVVLHTRTGGAKYFEAWGTDGNGGSFCCDMPADPAGGAAPYYNTIDVSGTSHADILSFACTVVGAGTFYLDSPRGLNEVSGTIHGLAEADSVLGGQGVNDYEEWLWGDRGDDQIWSNAGAISHMMGGDDEDSIIGSGGFNTIQGGDGDDYLQGGVGMDIIHGGDDDDCIEGLAGDDELYGDGGNDTIEGGDGEDTLAGGIGDDYLDGDAGGSFVATDTLVCGAHNDHWVDDTTYLDTHDASCEPYTVSSVTCP